MRVLKKGLKGPDVKKWQIFLAGQGFPFTQGADGIFGDETLTNTIAFQKKHKLGQDGKVGNQTLGQAMTLGFEVVDFLGDDETPFPAEPDFPPLVTNKDRQAVFGKFTFVHTPKPGNKETIRITGSWESDNIVPVMIPQLAGKKGAPMKNGVLRPVRFHKLAAQQLAGLWKAWEDAGLLDRVLSWEGGFVPRFVRCSTSVLSNHSFGSGFDINASFNAFGAQPALPGQKGCVFELVPIAHEFGFYWGGHFKNRRDGMHFEVAKIL
jgi:hypothetical protein